MEPGRRHPLHALALWVAFAPFLLLSLIAPGVMPAHADGSGATLVLCTAAGPVELVIDPMTGAPVPKVPAGGDDGRDCDWASGLGGLALAGRPATLLLPAPPSVSHRLAPSASIVLSHARVTGLPPATGPPAAA